MRILEDLWDCAQCQTKGISGLKSSCPSCGEPHDSQDDPSEEWYSPKDARVLTAPDELNYAHSGPMWNCGHCGQPNRGDQTRCGECEMPRDSVDHVPGYQSDAKGVPDNVRYLGSGWRGAAKPKKSEKGSSATPATNGTPANGMHWSQPPMGTDSGVNDGPRDHTDPPRVPLSVLRDFVGALRQRAKIVALSAVALSVVGGGGTALYDNYIATHTVDLTVQSMSWERQVQVEELRTLTNEDWSYPSDARVLSSRSEIRSYREVPDHYETRTRQVPEQKQTGTRTEQYACGSTRTSNGNGTSTEHTKYCTRSVPVYTTVYRTETYQVQIYRKEPVYDVKYRYEIDRWVTDHWDTANSSTHGRAPVWPGSTIRGSKQRVGNERHETYGVVLNDVEGRAFPKTFTEMSIWSRLEPGMMLKGEQTRMGDLREVHWP